MKEVKKTAAKKTTTKKVTPKKVAVAHEKTAHKKTTTAAKTTTQKKTFNKRFKSNKLTLAFTLIGIFACVICVAVDALNHDLLKMPLYAILLFIIMVEDKK